MSGTLFEIRVLHIGPKSHYDAIETYLIAPSETAVFEYLNRYAYEVWTDPDEMRWDEELGEEVPMVEWVMARRGDLEDDTGWEDVDHGITRWGWKPVEARAQDLQVLRRLGIAQDIDEHGNIKKKD